MSEIDDLDALLAELDADSPATSETVQEAAESDAGVAAVLDDVVVEAETIPEAPKPAPKKRGRPAKKKVAEEVKAPEEVSEASKENDNDAEEAEISASDVDSLPTDDEVRQTVQSHTAEQTPKDIYILQDTQIINGHAYRRGQKITFVKGDKFYMSQTDRNGHNWLDLVDDPEAQYAHFGKLIVEPDNWTGIPLGSVEGIEHPGLALAISKFAKEEYARNGKPFA